MRTRSVMCCLLLAACYVSAAAKKASGDYDKLVERVKGDKTVDFRELRLAYADSPGFDRGPDTDPQKTNVGGPFFQGLRNRDQERRHGAGERLCGYRRAHGRVHGI
jgi:hypothetical protein